MAEAQAPAQTAPLRLAGKSGYERKEALKPVKP